MASGGMPPRWRIAAAQLLRFGRFSLRRESAAVQVTGAQQGDGALRVLRLVPLGLHAQERALAAVHGAHHEGVLAAAALGLGTVVGEADGVAQRVLGVAWRHKMWWHVGLPNLN